MISRVVLGCVIVSLAGCGVVRNGLGTLGVGAGSATRATLDLEDTRFRARAFPDSDDKRNFSVTVTPVAVNPEGALEAARYQATRYCLKTYGGSDTEWTVGPDTPLSELQVVDDSASFSGRCTQR